MSIFDKTDKKFQEFLTVANENLDPFMMVIDMKVQKALEQGLKMKF